MFITVFFICYILFTTGSETHHVWHQGNERYHHPRILPTNSGRHGETIHLFRPNSNIQWRPFTYEGSNNWNNNNKNTQQQQKQHGNIRFPGQTSIEIQNGHKITQQQHQQHGNIRFPGQTSIEIRNGHKHDHCNCNRLKICEENRKAFDEKNPTSIEYSQRMERRVSESMRISEQECHEMYRGWNFHFGKSAAVEGIDVLYDEFPFMCTMGWKRNDDENAFVYECGCALISPSHVLTTAHCTSIQGQAPSVVRIGSVNLNDTNGQVSIIAKITVHPDFHKMFYNDIAIIELKDNSRHKPACLWQNDDIYGISMTALGYGQTSLSGPKSEGLTKVFLKLRPQTNCSAYYQDMEHFPTGIDQSHICAADPNNIMDTCQGDSGGPLLVQTYENNKKIPYILGLTLAGSGCANGVPGIYTRVVHYLDWIESIVWKERKGEV